MEATDRRIQIDVKPIDDREDNQSDVLPSPVHKQVVSANNCVLIDIREYQRLVQFEKRAADKLEQLKQEKQDDITKTRIERFFCGCWARFKSKRTRHFTGFG